MYSRDPAICSRDPVIHSRSPTAQKFRYNSFDEQLDNFSWTQIQQHNKNRRQLFRRDFVLFCFNWFACKSTPRRQRRRWNGMETKSKAQRGAAWTFKHGCQKICFVKIRKIWKPWKYTTDVDEWKWHKKRFESTNTSNINFNTEKIHFVS